MKSRMIAERRARVGGKAVVRLVGAKAAAIDYRSLHQAGVLERVQAIRNGLPATIVEDLADSMAIPKDRLMSMLGLARATVDRKVREQKPLSSDESSRLLGVARLIGQFQTMVEASGNKEPFDAARWVAHWLEQPMAAIGGQRPSDLMDTPDGQACIAQLASRIQSGAFS